MSFFVLYISDTVGRNFASQVYTVIQKVFIRNVFWRFYAKSKFCVCFEVRIPVLILIHFQISSVISSGQNIEISALLIRLTILSGKFLMQGWPSWMGSASPLHLITIFWLGYLKITILKIRHKHFLTKANVSLIYHSMIYAQCAIENYSIL